MIFFACVFQRTSETPGSYATVNKLIAVFVLWLFPLPASCGQSPGTPRQRFADALSRPAVTRADSGKEEFNKSAIFRLVIATSVSSAYCSTTGAHVRVGGSFTSIGIHFALEGAFDLLEESWPDAARKMKLSMWIRNLVRSSLGDSVRVS
jgi:hypothetical protein